MNLEQCRDILGTMSDAHVAKHAGCSPRAARRYRIALGIPPVKREYASVLDSYEDAYGIIPDYVIAYMTGETVAAVARHRYDLVILEPKEWPGEQTAYERVDEWIDIVGALPDETVAGFVGVSAAEVTAYREARGFLLECETIAAKSLTDVRRVPGSRASEIESFVINMSRPVPNREVSAAFGLTPEKASATLSDLVNAGRLVKLATGVHSAPVNAL